jgi:hypothetical protein
MTRASDALIQTLSNEWPPHADFFSTWAGVAYVYMYPTCYLENAKLTPDQKKRLKPMLEAAMTLFNTQPAKDLYQEIQKCYHLDYTLKNFYEVNRCLDKREFEKISAQLEECSIAAFEECEHEYGSVPLLGRFAKAYVEVNTKSEWNQHIWWLSAFYKHALVNKTLDEISHEQRNRFKLLADSFKVLEQKVLGKPSVKRQMEMALKTNNISKKITTKSEKITSMACKALLKKPGFQEGLKMFDELAGFTLIKIKFCNDAAINEQ